MRIIAAALVALLSASAAIAERSSLISHDDDWNMFSKFELSSTDIDESSALLGGISVGGLLNDRIGFGIAAHSLIDSVDTQAARLQSIDNTDFWYGGAYLEYVFSSYNLVYVSLDVLVGGGRLEIKETAGGEDQVNLFAVEPGLNLMINITETFSFGLGVSYRFIDNVDIEGLDDDALSGTSWNAFLRFTQF